MTLDEFLRDLHFDIEHVRPSDLHVNWEDAPAPFKIYQGLPAVSLPEPSLSIKPVDKQTRAGTTLQDIADFFWYSYGLTGVCQAAFPTDAGEPGLSVIQMLRRFAPSGGGLYPSELYAYLKIDGLDAGVYHYDVAGHRLVLLREGDFDSYLERSLGGRCAIAGCFGVLFVSTMFWKNFFKYHYFSYRLQGLDAGALIGQLLATARQFGFSPGVMFQFLDESLNHLLGLRDEEETVYAAIPLALSPNAIAMKAPPVAGQAERAKDLCGELPALNHRQYMKSKQIGEYPMIVKLNRAAMLDSTDRFTRMPEGLSAAALPSDGATMLPQADGPRHDFAAACRRRYSPGPEFVPGRTTLADVAALFRDTTAAASCTTDVAAASVQDDSRLAIAACIHGIDGLDDGAYIYDAKRHNLQMLAEGDHRHRLQQGLSMHNVNLYQVPVCVHLVGDRDSYRTTFGIRGYRMQQMEAGMLLQQLLLTASALGMGGHPLLGYDEAWCDGIYGFEGQSRTCLIQVPVGFCQKRSRFEGSLP